MKQLDQATLIKLIVFAVATVLVGSLVALKAIPNSEAITSFTVVVSALLGALGLKAAGAHIGEGISAHASTSAITAREAMDSMNRTLSEMGTTSIPVVPDVASKSGGPS